MESIAERFFLSLVFFSVVSGFYFTFVGYAVIVHRKYSLLTHRRLFRVRRFESIFRKKSFKRYAAWSMLLVGLANYLSLALHLGLSMSLLVVPIALFGGIVVLLITYGVGLWLYR